MFWVRGLSLLVVRLGFILVDESFEIFCHIRMMAESSIESETSKHVGFLLTSSWEGDQYTPERVEHVAMSASGSTFGQGS